MKKLTRILALMLVVIMVASLIACSETTETKKAGQQTTAAANQTKKPSNGKNFVIGFSVSGLNHPMFAFEKKLFENKCKELGVEYVITDGELKTDKQLNDIDTLISKKVDALLIMPNDSKGLIPGAEKATAAGIPVFVVTRLIPSEKDYVTFVGSDDYMIGRMAGDYIATALKGKGNVVEITGTPGVSTAIDRSKGFNDVIKNYPNLKLVAQQTAKYQRNEAMTVMEAIIR
jgi:ABC-type sugar transport system substrate-binding protein